MTTTEPSLQDLVPIDGVWDQLERVEERLFEASLSDDGFLTKVAQHLLQAGGKRFRPLLALLAAEFGPADDDRPVEAGVAVELIHVGSLYHDDVIDEADTRRGAASVNSNWTNTVAILAGDFLMARASEVAATRLGQESVRLLARTYAELVEGQTRELQLVGDLEHTVEEYYRVIGGKTASLIRTSARLGAMASDATPSAVEAVSTWAWELGLVFQMTDDALDLVGTEESIGKPAGSDIREGTFTLPVLLARDAPDGARVRQLLSQPPALSRRGGRGGDLPGARCRLGRPGARRGAASLDDGHRGDGVSPRRDGSRCPHHHGDLPGGAGRGGQGVSGLDDRPVGRDPSLWAGPNHRNEGSGCTPSVDSRLLPRSAQ